MNKKIFTVFALLVVITSISAVSAFDLGDIFGVNVENETVTIEGIDFNIPAGFKEDSSSTFNIIEELVNDGYVFDGKVYAKDNTKVGIFVYKYNSSDSGNDDILDNFANETPVDDIGGFIEFDNNEHVYAYTKDNCVVLIASNEKNVINDFIID